MFLSTAILTAQKGFLVSSRNTDYINLYVHEKAAFHFTGFVSQLPNNQFGYIGAILTLLELVNVKPQSQGKFLNLGFFEHLGETHGSTCIPYVGQPISGVNPPVYRALTSGSYSYYSSAGQYENQN